MATAKSETYISQKPFSPILDCQPAPIQGTSVKKREFSLLARLIPPTDTLHNVYYTLYTVHSTLCTVHYTQYIVNCLLYTKHCTLYLYTILVVPLAGQGVEEAGLLGGVDCWQDNLHLVKSSPSRPAERTSLGLPGKSASGTWILLDLYWIITPIICPI